MAAAVANIVMATATGTTATARADAIGIVLSDGKVLAAGGEGEQNKAINSTEIWDPATGEWTEISPLIEERDSTDAVLLNDGTVLVAGGRSEAYSLMNTVEIFDPKTNEWTSAAPMMDTRIAHTTTPFKMVESW